MLQEEKRIVEEEETCYMAKEQWPLISRRYQPLRLIGKGGFSEVYIAHDLEVHSEVAIKLSDV